MSVFEAPGVTLHHGDCIEVMRTLPDASVDAVVTDPPYALEFMGRGWDKYTPLEFELWVSQWAAECLRVLKPGGHMLAFGGSRTWHRLAAGIEDAGFDIRDSIAWLYGSGFPKSLDVSKAIDKAAGAERDVVGTGKRSRNVAHEGWDRPWMREQMEAIGGSGMAEYPLTAPATDGARREATHKSGMFPTFHYEAKAPSSERPDVDGVMHPTVKPLDLMRWLVRLVTPPNGTILEPFAGSGTTLEAALIEGFNVIGIEREADYLPLIKARITKPLQPAMFGDWDVTS